MSHVKPTTDRPLADWERELLRYPDEDLSHRSHRHQVENAEQFAKQRDEDDHLESRGQFNACRVCHPEGVAACAACGAYLVERESANAEAQRLRARAKALTERADELEWAS